MRRVGKVLTGVDRVEYAYAIALLADEVPLYGLIRAPLGYILLDQTGIEDILPFLSGPDPSVEADSQRKYTWRRARRHAIGRRPPSLLKRMLRRAFPAGVTYFNVGHSNLSDRVLEALREIDARIVVLIHDVIPLEFPHYQREGSVPPFADMIKRVGSKADIIIYNSNDTRQKTEARMDTPPPGIVAHLGTNKVVEAPEELPLGLPPERPFFLCVGTIEPRKNHRFLLDLWAELGDGAPSLIIAGSRGWKNEEVFARLDALPTDGPIREVAGLSDGALASLISASAGVLFPTHAEGFGLPATEAVIRGVPVVVNNLPVFHEFLGDIPIYANVSDRYLWEKSIKTLTAKWPHPVNPQQFQPPTWEAHFKTVLRLT